MNAIRTCDGHSVLSSALHGSMPSAGAIRSSRTPWSLRGHLWRRWNRDGCHRAPQASRSYRHRRHRRHSRHHRHRKQRTRRHRQCPGSLAAGIRRRSLTRRCVLFRARQTIGKLQYGHGVPSRQAPLRPLPATSQTSSNPLCRPACLSLDSCLVVDASPFRSCRPRVHQSRRRSRLRP